MLSLSLSPDYCLAQVKPDYIQTADIDAVIIAACYGAGRHGSMLSEFILGLLEGGAAGGPAGADAAGWGGALRWCSFCK